MPIPAFEGIGVPAAIQDKQCFSIGQQWIGSVLSTACEIMRAHPTLCHVTQSVCEDTLLSLYRGMTRVGAKFMCDGILGSCCGQKPPELDPPVPTDYEAGGMKPPSGYGVPTPLVGGCNCDHSDFGEESFDGAEITGNVSSYRP